MDKVEDKIFEVKINDQTVKLRIKKPNRQDLNTAKKTYNEAFSRALQSKAPLRKKILDILVEQGLWDDDKKTRENELIEQINSLEYKLYRGGISKSRGKEIALELIDFRRELVKLRTVFSEYDSMSAEGQAEDDQFNHLLALCVVYDNNGKPYFESYQDYLDRSNEKPSIEIAQEFAKVIYNVDKSYRDELAENEFLKEHKFIDDNYRLIDKEGRFVTRDGKLVDEEGNFLNEQGKRVDKFGHPLTEDGKFDVERQPFTDD